MEVKQIYKIINSVSNEVLGRTDIVTEDLTGIVDLGTELSNQKAIDNYVKSLVNHIGKVIFVNRPYAGKVPSVLMDAWEFGSVLEKISADVPKAEENDTWDLTDGKSYDQDVFHKPAVTAKFFNSKVTFEVPVSITERQVKESFSNAAQLNGFISMIYAAVEKSMTIKADALIMHTINNMIAETVLADAVAFEGTKDDLTGADLSSASTARCVNLLKLYNDKYFPATPAQGEGKPTPNPNALTAAKAITDPDFIRFASYVMGTYADRLQSISTVFNVGGKERFTPKDMLHVVLLSDFAKAAQTYLYSDTFNRGDVLLPQAETVPFWQGSGQNYEFASTGNIRIKESGGGKEVNISGVLGVMFDRDALGVCNLDRRVTTNYNAKAEFFNNYYKFDAGYFNDTNENFVVFFIE